MDCLFCKIVKKEIPAQIVYEDQYTLGFKDIHPVAAIHLLFIPKLHSKNFIEFVEQDQFHLFKAIAKFQRTMDPTPQGFRLITNIGADSGQEIFHTHFHLLGGQKLGPLLQR